MEAGDEVVVAVRFRADDTLISWTIQPPNNAPRQQMSTFNATVLTPADLVNDRDSPLKLSDDGAARAYVLAQVDGTRSSQEIIAKVLSERPDLQPTEAAIRDFVQAVLARDCST